MTDNINYDNLIHLIGDNISYNVVIKQHTEYDLDHDTYTQLNRFIINELNIEIIKRTEYYMQGTGTEKIIEDEATYIINKLNDDANNDPVFKEIILTTDVIINCINLCKQSDTLNETLNNLLVD